LSYTYFVAQERVNDIIKMLPADDRQVLEAYVRDVRDDARRERPKSTFAAWAGVSLAVVAGMVGAAYFVAPRLPPSVREACPEAAQPLDWHHLDDYKVRRATTDSMACIWPDNTWTFMCTIKAPSPDNEDVVLPAPR
jgi:hypothetical protein